MDAPCKIQGSIHVFRLVNNMCPGKWVHISKGTFLFYKECALNSSADCVEIQAGGMSNTV